MRDPATYRSARRAKARELMRRMRESGRKLDWRAAWESVQAAYRATQRIAAKRKAEP